MADLPMSIFAIEELLKENEIRISNCKKQLQDAQNGVLDVSPMKLGSIESALEKATEKYTKYKEIYDNIPQKEKDALMEAQRVHEALNKQTYYKTQKIRLKRSKSLKRDQKLEAMMILDELYDDLNIDDDEIIEMSNIMIKSNMRVIGEIEKDLTNIKADFESRVSKIDDNKDLKHFKLLDTYIPIVILHFSLFVKNIEESIEEHNEKFDELDSERKLKFSGLPKYEDWWIEELFKNHQAYFGLYKWKDIISNICITLQQKIIWDKIFSNWLMIKKILVYKDENAYDYSLIFDDMIEKYIGLEEELNIQNLVSMEKIVYNITQHEDFSINKDKHEINPTYTKWKKSKKGK